MTDPITAGKHFDDAVRATSVIGEIGANLANVQTDVTEIKTDVKAIKTTMNEWTGSLKIWAAIPGGIAIALSVYNAFFK